jgi:hypothetical protein
MARATEFKNYNQCKVAAIEQVDLDTPLDERDPRHFSIPLGAEVRYPYVKTRAGALQAHMMPWDYRTRQLQFGAAGTLSAVIALACKVI